jgi:hypothetical protein
MYVNFCEAPEVRGLTCVMIQFVREEEKRSPYKSKDCSFKENSYDD